VRILFLTPQFPYPPHKGTTLRNYNLIAGLASRHERSTVVHGFTAAASPLDQLCRRIGTVIIPRRPNWRRAFDTAPRRGRTWDCACGQASFSGNSLRG
jgi:hypothetical protein